MNWRARAAINTVKAVIPFQAPLRRLKRRFVPYTTNYQNDQGLLDDSISQIEVLRELGVNLVGARVIELGPGWCPILAIVYRMSGAASVTMVDQERLMDLATLRYATQYVVDNFQARAAHLGVACENFGPVPDALRAPTRIDRTLETGGLIYLAPFEFGDLPDNSADLIVSRVVLEHVPEKLLSEIARDSRRILKPGGLVCHTIDMSDHWSHHDKSISAVNFLRYGEKTWRWTGINKQDLQNRLRRSEYLKIFGDAGFSVRYATGEPNAVALKALQSFVPCRRYATMAPEELAVLRTTIVAERPR